MKTNRAKAAFLLGSILTAAGASYLLETLGARPELQAVVIVPILAAIGLSIVAFWELSPEPPRWVRNREARRKAASGDH
jgi:hypothetical protein